MFINRVRVSILAAVLLGMNLGAAPAPPSYSGVRSAIEEMRANFATPAEGAASDWSAWLNDLEQELKNYASAASENDRLRSLGTIYKKLRCAGHLPGMGPREQAGGHD